MLLLADGEVERITERPLRPKLGEAVVKGLQVRAADHLGMQRELVEELPLKPHAQTAVFKAFLILTVAAIRPVLLAMVAAQQPELLHDRVVFVGVDAAQVLEHITQALGRGRRHSSGQVGRLCIGFASCEGGQAGSGEGQYNEAAGDHVRSHGWWATLV